MAEGVTALREPGRFGGKGVQTLIWSWPNFRKRKAEGLRRYVGKGH